MGSAISNFNLHGFTVLLVFNFYFGAEGQGIMSRREFAFAVGLAIGHFFTLKLIAVKRCLAFLGKGPATGTATHNRNG